MTVHQCLEHAWLKGDHSSRTQRIPSSRYDKIRAKIREKYVSSTVRNLSKFYLLLHTLKIRSGQANLMCSRIFDL